MISSSIKDGGAFRRLIKCLKPKTSIFPQITISGEFQIFWMVWEKPFRKDGAVQRNYYDNLKYLNAFRRKLLKRLNSGQMPEGSMELINWSERNKSISNFQNSNSIALFQTTHSQNAQEISNRFLWTSWNRKSLRKINRDHFVSWCLQTILNRKTSFRELDLPMSDGVNIRVNCENRPMKQGTINWKTLVTELIQQLFVTAHFFFFPMDPPPSPCSSLIIVLSLSFSGIWLFSENMLYASFLPNAHQFMHYTAPCLPQLYLCFCVHSLSSRMFS